MEDDNSPKKLKAWPSSLDSSEIAVVTKSSWVGFSVAGRSTSEMQTLLSSELDVSRMTPESEKTKGEMSYK